MSSTREKRRKVSGPMPAMSAGLLRFFEEETTGIKVKPEVVMIASVVLIIVAIIGQLQLRGILPFI
jgi:preprotein translocase subunit Sec61beta